MNKRELVLVIFVLIDTLILEVRYSSGRRERKSWRLMLGFLNGMTHVSLPAEIRQLIFLLIAFLLIDNFPCGLSYRHHKLGNGLVQVRAIHGVFLKNLIKEVRKPVYLNEPIFIFVCFFVILLGQNKLVVYE